MHGIDARRVRTRHLAQAKAQGTKITALTSYDALTAAIFDEAGIDLLLVGDSAANVVLGQDSTLGITLEEMITMARAVAGAAKRAFVVCDLPFGSYEESDAQAVASSVRLMKETGVAAVKIEGGVEMAPTIRRIVDAGIPVVAHIGYTPQSEHTLGGHVVQGRGDAAERLLADAAAVAVAGPAPSAAGAVRPAPWARGGVVRGGVTRSQGVVVNLAGAHAHHPVDGADPDLAVADLAGVGGLHDRVEGVGDLVVGDEDLDLDLGHEVGGVLGTAVDLGVAALLAVALDLGDRHAVDIGLVEGGADVGEGERLDDRGD